MSVVLVILATIGYILLFVLALLLLVVFAVLFCPVKYNGMAEKTEKMEAGLKASYLFFIRFKAEFKDGNFVYILKIFGRVKKTNIASINEQIETEKRRKAARKAQKLKKKSDKKTGNIKLSKKEENLDIANIEPDKNKKESDSFVFVNENKDIIDENNKATIDENQKNVNINYDEKRKPGRLKAVFEAVKQKIADLFTKIRQIFDNIEGFFSKIERRYDLVTEDENSILISKLLHLLKKVFKHILPRKIKGYLQFGFSSPDLTGKALGVLAVFYPRYRKSLRIEAVFTESVLIAEVSFRGHVTIFVLLFAAARVYFSKKYKALWHGLSDFSEEDTEDDF
ncbi:MAG: hypothetical protein MJ113_07120 [Lachnospiraceae bacterium]|nr:hypothetical protein [Lachnospiraceae bacterium]